MATYKVIQDIEAEDHILGPLSLRQFIYALIAVFCFYLSFLSITKLHAAFLLIIFLPPGLFCAFFAFPFGRDQSTEIWALAKLRFMLKPRRRIWDQSGVKELVTITVPKKVEAVLTDGLSQTEVKSRLSALANTIDSRGWAVKGVAVNAYTQPDPFMSQSSDRLIDVSNIPQQVPNYDVQAADDMLDEKNNPIARQFDQMITESAQTHRQQLFDQMNSPVQPVATQPTAAVPANNPLLATATAPTADYWFMSDVPDQGAAQTALPSAPVAAETPDEAVLAKKLKAQNSAPKASYAHLRTLQPLDKQPANQADPMLPPLAATDDMAAPAASTPGPDPAILSLANNNDLNVATLAREAHKATGDEPPQDEVVISLH